MIGLGILVAAWLAAPAAADPGGPDGRVLRVLEPAGLQLHHVKADLVTHRGRDALRLIEAARSEAPGAPAGGPAIAVLAGPDFRDGVIETELAGAPAEGAPVDSRGFVGIAFRVQGNAERFECFYLRPTNGRAPDQLRRNHATQYISHPDHPWHRLRKESPGMYESYVDLVPAEWTRIRIVVEGTRAQLFVHGAEQPALIVNDLKLGDTAGRIALWIGQGTEAWFTDVKVTTPPR